MNKDMHYGEDYKPIPAFSLDSGDGVEVLPDLYHYTVQIVNIQMVGQPENGSFVLIDAGMPGSAASIIEVVENRFGPDSRPQAIVLTHGHFDHVGAIIELTNHWDVPVYAHEAEFPYLTGQQRYPEPDPTVEGGLIAKQSLFFPVDPINLGDRIKPLPEDGKVPHLPDFRWIHTPGHTPGHVSLFRASDRTLIAGDAFVTVRQDSLYRVFLQDAELNGPPRYLTPDWPTARESVRRLADLQPHIAVTGHGPPMDGEPLAEGLRHLADSFDEVAIPDYGKYVQ